MLFIDYFIDLKLLFLLFFIVLYISVGLCSFDLPEYIWFYVLQKVKYMNIVTGSGFLAMLQQRIV